MKNINENVINKMKKIVKDKQAMKIDGVLVDLYTASAVTQIYDKVNPANKKKMEKMSPQGLATAAFKILGKKESVSEEKATPEEKAELALKHAKETESLKGKQGREKETLMQREDASGMNPKQKMKFDQLMKKLKGGKEHMKFKRMADNPVEGDDMFHGYVKDLAMKEAVDFSDAQLSKMKKAYSTLKRIDPSSQNYKKLKTSIRKLDVNRLEQLARAKIKFVSTIAAGEYAIKSGKRLHARDYLESTELEESVKISFHSKGAKTKWMKKQGVASKEIINQTPTSVELPPRWKDLSKKKDHDEIFSVVMEYTTVSPKMAKVFDSLKVGDKIAYKTKRYSSDGHKVTKKEMLRHNQAGIERITLGKGVYLLKKEKTKEVMMKTGNMPVTIIDLVKESMNETVQVNEVQGSDYDFSPIQLSRLKKAYSTVKRIDPSSQNYKKLKKAISKLHPNTLEKIAREKIRFVSVIAAGEYEKKSGKRLHARDYMWFAESTVIEKAMTLGGTNAPSGETYMGDKGIQKMVALSKKNPNIEYTVKSDNYGDFKAHWLKNGKFAKRTVANINFDMDKNAVRGVPKGKTVKSTIFVLRYSVNEGVQMENDEYDNEGGMALSQLRTAKSAVEDLMSSIKEMDNLPEWVQSKLTKAVDYMDSVRDYMASEESEEPVEESMARARADARRHMSGRGAQKGMAPLKKDVDNDATDGDRKAASKHIIQQLRKAADLPNGAEVEFKNGKGKVDRNSAQMVLKKYLAIKKPMDKEKFQANIKSLSDVKKILGR